MYAATKHSSGLLIHDAGLTEYRAMLELQRNLFNELIEAKKKGETGNEYLILTEHKPVYTIGRHGHPENLLVSEAVLASGHVALERIERGGDITFHGPGQLVAYPIIDLQKRRLGVKEYVSILEQAVINTIGRFGINGERVEGATGVWIGKGTPRERKICAIGVKCSRFVTMHGLALNVNTDLSWFSRINPCGFVDKGVTSIAIETGSDADMGLVKSILATELAALLSAKL